MRKIKNVCLLAGGVSKRLWPLDHKVLMTFQGEPLIIHQLKELSVYAEKITVITHKENATVVKRLLENSPRHLDCQVIVQKEDFPGQAGAIHSAKNLVKGEVLIVNGSDMIDFSVLEKITKLEKPANKIILMGKRLNEYFPGGYLRFDDNKRLLGVVEKPGKDKMPSQIFKLVVDYFSDFDQLVKTIESVKTQNDDHYEQAINKLLEGEVSREYLAYEGYMSGLKYPWHVLPMMKIILSKQTTSSIASSAVISKKAEIVGPVVIGEDVRIGDYAKVVGPAFIGNNTIIADYAMIRESQIGEDCLVGSTTEVARSYIGNKVFLHRNYVGDSVMADGSMMGAGAVTANLRFDADVVKSVIGEDKIETGLVKFGAIIGQGSKIGVNATIVPGVKIGKNCLVAPGEVVRADLEDNTFLAQGEEKENRKI